MRIISAILCTILQVNFGVFFSQVTWSSASRPSIAFHEKRERRALHEICGRSCSFERERERAALPLKLQIGLICRTSGCARRILTSITRARNREKVAAASFRDFFSEGRGLFGINFAPAPTKFHEKPSRLCKKPTDKIVKRVAVSSRNFNAPPTLPFPSLSLSLSERTLQMWSSNKSRFLLLSRKKTKKRRRCRKVEELRAESFVRRCARFDRACTSRIYGHLRRLSRFPLESEYNPFC